MDFLRENDMSNGILSIDYHTALPLTKETTQNEPDVIITPSVSVKGKKYVLIMYDDFRIQNEKRCFVHWVKTNMGSNVNGSTLLPYFPPTPPPNTGTHKYTFALYLQREKEEKREKEGKMKRNSFPDLETLGIDREAIPVTVSFLLETTGRKGGRKTRRRRCTTSFSKRGAQTCRSPRRGPSDPRPRRLRRLFK